MLIAGPARSGKSTLLLTIAEILQTSTEPVKIWAACTRRSPLADAEFEQVAIGDDETIAMLTAARMQTEPLVILIDDAEKFTEAKDDLSDLISEAKPNIHIIAAGRSDDLRSTYSGWTVAVRKARAGILLQPAPDSDAALLGVNIPRVPPVALTQGRGYLCVSGVSHLIQCFTPEGFITNSDMRQ